jgi:hypothetical protein
MEWGLVAFFLAIDVVVIWLIIEFGCSTDTGFPLAITWLGFGFVLLIVNGLVALLLRDLRLGVRGHTRIWLAGVEDFIDQQRRAGAIDPRRRLRAVLSPQALTEIIEDHRMVGAVAITTVVTSEAPWSEIPTIHVTGMHAFFKVGDAGWLILPRAAFDDDDAFFHFVATASRYKDGDATEVNSQTTPLAIQGENRIQPSKS